MRSDAPALLPILRSRHLAEILTVLLLHPDVEYTLSELAATIGLPLTTVQREVTRLSNAQLIQERRVGRSRLVSADLSSRYARPLTELVTLAFGPHFVIGEEFGSLGAAASDPNVPSGRPARPAGERRPGDVPPVGQRAE